LEFYKHVVKSRNARKMIFVVFKKSMRKHIFETSNICFLDKKKRKNNVRVLAVCMKTKHFFLLTKTGYFNTGFVSLRYKNTNQY
jgi:hypothetical protein